MKTDFWTSTEYSGFMVGLIRELRARGVEARQKYHITESSYRGARSTPARLFLRFRQYVLYPVKLCASLVLQRIRYSGKVGRSESGKVGGQEAKQTPSHLSTFPHSHSDEVCVVSTNTFYSPLLATYLHPNVIHLVYDLFPEAMIHSGKWREGSLKVKIVRWITRKTLQRAQCNVFLGERLKQYVESIHGPVANSAIIAVGADQALFGQSPRERIEDRGQRTEDRGQKAEDGGQKAEGRSQELGARSQRTEDREQRSGGDSVCTALRPVRQAQGNTESSATILYCGNLGNMHDTATLFAYWESVAVSRTAEGSRPYLDWRFHCAGPKRGVLEATVAKLSCELREKIYLGSGLGQKQWIAAMEDAAIALVTMAPGSETVVMPSKTYSAMMAGQAILAVAPEDSDLVDLIKAADCGWWVKPGDVDGLASAIAEIQADPEGLLEKRERAYAYAREHFGQDRLAEEWVHALRAMLDDGAR